LAGQSAKGADEMPAEVGAETVENPVAGGSKGRTKEETARLQRLAQNRKDNARAVSGLVRLYWTAPGAATCSGRAGAEPRLTVFARFSQLVIFIMFAHSCLEAFTFLAGWDPRIHALIEPATTVACGYSLQSLLHNTHPKTGALVTMSSFVGLLREDIERTRRWRKLLVAMAVLLLLTPLGSTYTIISNASNLTKLEFAYHDDPTVSSNASHWGGYAGTPFALTVRVTESLLESLSISLVLCPWALSLGAPPLASCSCSCSCSCPCC